MENDFGQKIKNIRKERGLTQQEFADSLGYAHKSTINKIESGQEDMSYQKILVLLKEYMLSASDLFDDHSEGLKRIDELIEKSKNPAHEGCVVYIHGLFGDKKEADFYSFYTNKYDVIGLDYQDGNPWEVKDKIIKKFDEIYSKYKEIYVIANSIGAFYTYMYLTGYRIKTAFFISPLINMKAVIEKMMRKYDISMRRLKNEKYIKLDNGQTLSYDFYQSLNGKDNWKVRTHILYGEKDNLVSNQEIFDFVKEHNVSLTIMKNGEHYFHTPSQLKYIRKWINGFI